MEKKDVVKSIKNGEDFKKIHSAISNNAVRKIYVTGFTGSWLRCALSDGITPNTSPILLVCQDREAAGYAYGDMQLLLGEENVLFYPASYRRAYQNEEVDNANILLRGEVLSSLAQGGYGKCVVTYTDALFEKVLSGASIKQKTFSLDTSEKISIEDLTDMLEDGGFSREDFVFSAGQYSVRGGIVDVFSYSDTTAHRIEFFGDEIESIRSFDIETQLSVKKVEHISILSNVEEKSYTETRESFFDFLTEDTLVVSENVSACAGNIAKLWEKAESAYQTVKDSPVRRQTPEELFLNDKAYTRSMERLRVMEISGRAFFTPDVQVDVKVLPQPVFHRNFQLLAENMKENASNGLKNIIFSANATQSQRLRDIFADTDHDIHFDTIEGSLHQGFIDASSSLACYTDHQIFERYHRFAMPKQYSKEQALSLSQLSELEVGDYVTHIDHGVGRFAGLQKIDVDGHQQEAVKLVYAGGDILYVSIHSFHKISKYSGKEASVPKVDRLGSTAWKTLKDKAKKRVKQIAFDLIKLYAKRRTVKGFAFSPDNYLQNELEASFIYEDTPDQIKATEAIKKDMEGDRPMDRLVCGDVGFGKTEVAIRAAFKAVCDSKQVAVLVPTTILAFQHYRSFASRLKRMPVRVEYVNRFRSAKEKAKILQDLADGKVDIIIGTHQIVGKKVKFKDLGLLIIDEEHKFGVGVKDKLKTIKTTVDTLTLTATPIPRTLQFSLMSARDLSVIATPPPNRHPINTQVITMDQEIIRDAIQYELSRGGQVFFINNRIENIREIAGMVQRLVPDARVAVGHGQMKGNELEDLMLGFMEGKYDVLVSTTIVESGLDVPNANTIFVNNAHMFGLSDLHQMRGRVGRSNKNAFCYYIAPPYSSMTDDARHRLEALEKYSAVGQGINIAMKDLEIRGAGDLLGAEQSGFISDIGFDTYQKILSEAVEELRHDEFAELFDDDKNNDSLTFTPPETQIDTDFELLIPDDYVSSSVERLRLYNTLTGLKTDVELEKFSAELTDRFGALPVEVKDLFDSIRMKWNASALGVERLLMKKGVMRIYFPEDSSSVYFKSDVFAKILSWGGAHTAICRFEEKTQKSGRVALVLRISGVVSLESAKKVLDDIYSTVFSKEK
ncbi:MAG: transcription-repair coupling factor [Flavobacteriales bacterium]|nr:transcription-repair coupling factor [Flavobacteriales bacterium]